MALAMLLVTQKVSELVLGLVLGLVPKFLHPLLAGWLQGGLLVLELVAMLVMMMGTMCLGFEHLLSEIWLHHPSLENGLLEQMWGKTTKVDLLGWLWEK